MNASPDTTKYPRTTKFVSYTCRALARRQLASAPPCVRQRAPHVSAPAPRSQHRPLALAPAAPEARRDGGGVGSRGIVLATATTLPKRLNSQPYARALSLSLALSLTHTHSLSLPLSLTHTPTHTPTPTPTPTPACGAWGARICACCLETWGPNTPHPPPSPASPTPPNTPERVHTAYEDTYVRV